MAGGNEELSEYEQLRLRNIQENYQKMVELGLITEKKKPVPEETTTRVVRRRKSCFKSKSIEVVRRIPTRQSVRLSNAGEEMTFADISNVMLGDVEVTELSQNEYYSELCGEDDSDDESLDVNKYSILSVEDTKSSDEENAGNKSPKKRKRRESSFGPRKRVRFDLPPSPRSFLSPEDITDEMLDNIAEHSTIKTYSQDGTTCHQCRQKTLDQKSICRSETCCGVRGQFCGPCLKNRYGELVKDALLIPEWNCPVCRGICNCSICRNQLGKAPTGPLAPFALSQGFKSVHELLIKEEPDDDY